MKSATKTILFYLISIALAVILLSHFIHKANLNIVWKELKSANIFFVFLAVLGELLFIIIRVIRWKIILNPLKKNLKNAILLKATVVSFAVSGVAPAKLGEILRPILISRWEGIPLSSSFASIVVERGLDLMAIVTFWMFFIFFGKVGVSEESQPYIFFLNRISIVILIGFLLIIPLIFLYAKNKSLFEENVKKSPFFKKNTIFGKIVEHFFIFSEGIMSFRKKRIIFLLYLVSLLCWGFVAMTCYFAPRAVHLNLPYTSGFLILTLVSIGASIPTPGGLGGVHKAIYIALSIFYSIDEETSVSSAILGHAMMFLPSILWGAFYFITGKVQIKEIK